MLYLSEFSVIVYDYIFGYDSRVLQALVKFIYIIIVVRLVVKRYIIYSIVSNKISAPMQKQVILLMESGQYPFG